MESERYKEYHFFWGIFSKLCKFLSFTYLSEPHNAYMHRHLKEPSMVLCQAVKTMEFSIISQVPGLQILRILEVNPILQINQVLQT